MVFFDVTGNYNHPFARAGPCTPMSVHLLLYGTAACHLCEQAAALLRQVQLAADIVWTEIDIAENEPLLQRYGILIPVLRREDRGLELHWPFSADDISAWLQS